jgi:serine dehydrogenase proteinase
MPNWKNLLSEVEAAGTTYDVVRRKYLGKLFQVTGRNVIIYYSGWLHKADLEKLGYTGLGILDGDKNGFMATIHELDRTKGLDLFLHTPGGDIAATESLVDYLRSMFGNNIRAFIPQLALSAGTMIALSCKEIILGKHSSLGPIDPQIHGLPAHGIIEEFDRAAKEIKVDQSRIPLWQPIIAKYHPALIGECQKAIAWSNQMVKEWLISGMFDGDANSDQKADAIISELADHALTKSHARHISLKRAQDMGIKAIALEDDPNLQEAALSVHHACIQTLSATPTCKIIENHTGVAYIDTFETD